MPIEEIIRGWKDPRYRARLSEAERTALPEHPAGLIELSDPELNEVVGGASIACTATLRCQTINCPTGIRCDTGGNTICSCSSLNGCNTESSQCGNTWGACSADASCTYDSSCTAAGCSFGDTICP